MALFRERFVVRFLHIGTTAAVVAVGLAFAYDSFSTPLTRLLEALFPQGISLVLLVLALIESLWFRPGDVPGISSRGPQAGGLPHELCLPRPARAVFRRPRKRFLPRGGLRHPHLAVDGERLPSVSKTSRFSWKMTFVAGFVLRNVSEPTPRMLNFVGIGRLPGRFVVHLKGGLHQDHPKTGLSSPPASVVA